jgi:hypothetical protein
MRQELKTSENGFLTMKLIAIRRLVENYTIDQLQQAEFDIIQEKSLSILLDGKDQAEKLSIVIAAVWILEEMKEGHDFKEAFCQYAKKVRD